MSLKQALREEKRLKRLEFRLERFKHYVKRIKEWITEREQRLQKALNGLSEEDYHLFLYKAGYLNQMTLFDLKKRKRK